MVVWASEYKENKEQVLNKIKKEIKLLDIE
jgi:hypothetical protein